MLAAVLKPVVLAATSLSLARKRRLDANSTDLGLFRTAGF